MNDQFLRLPEVMAVTGLPQSTIYDYIRDGRFPKQVKLSARSVGWLKSEIAKWINDRIEMARMSGTQRV